MSSVTLTEMHRIHFRVFSLDDFDATCRLARHPLTSTETLESLWVDAQQMDHGCRHQLCRHLFANESFPAETLDGLADEIIGDGSGENSGGLEVVRDLVGNSALSQMLQHRAAGARSVELWNHTGAKRLSLLANPAVDPELLHENYIEAPEHVAENPAATAYTIDEITNRYVAATRMFAVGHPACAAHLLEIALADPSAATRARVYRNPNYRDLRGALERELERCGPYSEPVDVLCDRLGEQYPVDWRDETVTGLVDPSRQITHGARFRVEVAEALSASSATELDAMASLVHGGFAGTVAELLDVADAVSSAELVGAAAAGTVR